MRRAIRYALFLSLDLVLIGALSFLCSVGKVTRADSNSSTHQQSPDESQAVSGTIASFRDNALTLTIVQAFSNAARSQETTPKSINFVIDKNTTIDGKIRVGASAEVTYRKDNEKNVALNVRVAP